MDWKTISILALNTLASVSGSVSAKLAVKHDSLVFASLGGAFWSMSAVTFLYLLTRNIELGVLSVVTQALGLIGVMLISIAYFGEGVTSQKLLALALVVAGIALASWPTQTG
ncbi:MAG: hypothetical protein KDA50_06485 [Rhodobacteraceae bacterium]|nr:hypothetical protein [Paracoccaceae bacterium]